MNGNSHITSVFLCLLLVLGAVACDSSKRTTKTPPVKTQPTKPDAPKDGEITDKVPDSTPQDTFIVEEIDPPAIPDIDLPPGPEGAVVSMMLPLMSSEFYSSSARLPQNSDWGIAYLAGAKLALKALERFGETATIHVFDNEASASRSQTLMRDPELVKSHAIIGPYLTKNAKAAITAGQLTGIPMIVPFSAASRLADGYPQLIQMQPGLLTHLDQMAAFLHDTDDPGQVVLVGLPTGEQDQEVRYLLQRQKVLEPAAKTWRTWKLESSSVGLQNLAWDDKFVEDQETIFVFPAYQNPKLVLSFLSQLQIGRAGRDATVFGMPQWADFQQLDPAMMEDLGVLITAGFHVDSEDFQVRQFEDEYVNTYQTLPPLAAYLGYDAMRFVVPLANKYGRKWTEHLPTDAPGLASAYRFTPQYSGRTAAEGSADYQENTAVHILRYRNFGFRPLD